LIAHWRSLRRLLSGSGRLLLASLAVSVVQSLLLVPVALLVRHAFDSEIPAEDLGALVGIGALILVLYLLSAGCELWTRYMSLRVTKDSVTRLRTELLEKIYGFPRAYFDRGDLGTLHSTIVQDSERLDEMGNALVMLVLPSVVVAGALAITALVLNPLLFAVLASVGPGLVLLSRWLGRAVRARTRAWHRAFHVFSSETLLALRAMTLTKVHGADSLELARRIPQLQELGRAGRGMVWVQSAYTLTNDAVAAASGVIVLVIGGTAVAGGSMSLGDLASFFAVLAMLRGQVTRTLVGVPQVLSGIESLSRLEEILDSKVREPYRGARGISFRGDVALESVEFGYGEGLVLRDISIHVGAHEHVALVGPNGAGKSTVVALILGLYRPWRGRVLADGIPLAELDLRHLRRQIGVVLQDPVIFPGTVRGNIAYGRPDAGEDEIRRAAARATADDVVAELPDGYDTPVGDEGVLLSGGQRQRIAIARAMLGHPKLLILDEPTTYLDEPAAQRLLATLREPGGPGVLIVTHDDPITRQADRAYVLRYGRVVEEGRPSRPGREIAEALPAGTQAG
jgi:ABC-type multidrug transport system fused ATPase/permease subunit